MPVPNARSCRCKVEPLSPAIECEQRDSGELLLSCPYAPGEPYQSITHLLLDRAGEIPDRTLVAERVDGDWKHLTYQQAVEGARRVAQWLLDHDATPETPLAILTGSSIRHFLMAWGAMFARVPYVPVSTSYSTVPGAYPKLNAVLSTVEPVFLFAEGFDQVDDALDSIEFDLANRVRIDGADDEEWSGILSTPVTSAVDDSIEQTDHDTVTRYMFTSGSTGMPKGVIVTQGMTCHMLAASAGLREPASLEAETRVLDWMPWSHVGAGVMRVASMLNVGGSIYLDTGKPVPAEFGKTLQNIREVLPTQFGGAPLGWSMLVDALEADDEFAKQFFGACRSIQFGSAAMANALAERIQRLCVKYLDHKYRWAHRCCRPRFTLASIAIGLANDTTSLACRCRDVS